MRGVTFPSVVKSLRLPGEGQGQEYIQLTNRDEGWPCRLSLPYFKIDTIKIKIKINTASATRSKPALMGVQAAGLPLFLGWSFRFMAAMLRWDFFVLFSSFRLLTSASVSSGWGRRGEVYTSYIRHEDFCPSSSVLRTSGDA